MRERDSGNSLDMAAAVKDHAAVDIASPIKSPFLEDAMKSSNFLGLVWGGSEYSGVACMAVSALLGAFMGLSVKLLARQAVPSLQMIFIRSILVSTMAGTLLRRNGVSAYNWFGSPNMRKVVMGRALCGFCGVSCFTYSLQVLPLKDAMVLNFTLPIFVAIFCSIFVGESWGLRDAAATVLSFSGVVLIAQPPFLFGGDVTSDDVSTGLRLFGVGMGITGAVAGAAAYTLLRVAGKGGEHTMVPVFAFATVSIPLSALCLLAFQTAVMPTLETLAGCILFGFLAFGAQVFLSRSMQLEKGGRASAMQYVKVLVSFGLGILFLNEVPTLSSVCGAVLICGASAVVAKQAGKA